uniref:Calcium voltage-gated channel auxiliary subunit gamma 5 n=3 Tax=Bos TaxID=9903 RepID=A0A4W2CFS4_BOBOX
MLLPTATLPAEFRPPPHPAPPLGQNSPSCRLLALGLEALSSRWTPVKGVGGSCSSPPLVSGTLGCLNGRMGERQHQPGAREDMGPSQRSGRQALHSPWERRRPLCPGGLPALVHPLPRGGSASLPGRACSRRCLALLPPEPTPAGLTGRMGACGRKALTLLSSVFAVCSLGLLGIAVSTDYWLYLEEGVVLAQNQSTETRMSLHSGLWRVCFLAGEEQGRCFTIEYVMPASAQLTSESTVSVLKMIRSATPFPLVSLFFMFIGFILSNIGHVRPHRTILAFVSGIFFILSGLSLVVGLVLYISSINDEMLNRTRDTETYFSYKYGWSFAFAAISFLLTESAGVMSVYLFMKRYTAEDLYRPHPGFYRPRLSNCSDYSGQFLHPDAWARGRSPSDLSSDASLQMNSSYPALLKCPDYDQMSTSPC